MGSYVNIYDTAKHVQYKSGFSLTEWKVTDKHREEARKIVW